MQSISGSTTSDGHDPYCQDVGSNGDYSIDQGWERYSLEEHVRWDCLFARQNRLLKDRAVPAFMEGLDVLRLVDSGIPHFERLSELLMRRTGWQVVAVPGLIPEHAFFDHLANRRFPAGNFIRRADQIDYLQEPDVFHDVYGHVPLLADPVFADYMQAYGEGGLRALKLDAIDRLARLYWYTVEFGLIRLPEGMRIFGAGILSSFGESVFALESASPNRIGFDLGRVMRTRYRIDDYQQTYFVIDSFEQLLRQTIDTDFVPLYEELAGRPDIPADALLGDDLVLNMGTQDYVKHRDAQCSIA
jgi:phenylalanine-4-hydroxylase